MSEELNTSLGIKRDPRFEPILEWYTKDIEKQKRSFSNRRRVFIYRLKIFFLSFFIDFEKLEKIEIEKRKAADAEWLENLKVCASLGIEPGFAGSAEDGYPCYLGPDKDRH